MESAWEWARGSRAPPRSLFLDSEMQVVGEGKSQSGQLTPATGNHNAGHCGTKTRRGRRAEAAVCTAYGIAADSSALPRAENAADELISTAKLYGGTYRLMRDCVGDLGYQSASRRQDIAGNRALVNSRTAFCTSRVRQIPPCAGGCRKGRAISEKKHN